MSSTSVFAFELIVLSSMVLGFGTWMLRQAKSMVPKRVVVLAKQRRR